MIQFSRLVRIGASAVALLASQSTSAEILLNQLSSCAMLITFRSELDRNTSCDAASSVLMKSLAGRLAKMSEGIGGMSVCVHANPPTVLQNGFECATITITIDRRSKELLCIREAGSADISDYKTNYRQVYATKVKRYLQTAAECEAGNGDASVAVDTMHPWAMMQISEFEFGYVLPIGDELVGSSAFVHGFGHVDPVVFGDEDRYVEYVHTWKDLP